MLRFIGLKFIMIRNIFRILGLFTFLIIIVGGSLIITKLIQNNNSPEDSFAITGGRIESGYKFAGFLVAQKSDNRANICGISFLNSKVGVTAAHCFDNYLEVYAALGDFNLDVGRINRAASVDLHQNWDTKLGWTLEQSKSDIAIITLKDSISANQFITIGTPDVSCNYIVVGYGQTGEENIDNTNRPRKSTDICITELDEQTMLFRGSGGGLCPGDSGSPIIKKSTNEVIGILSAVETLPNSSTVNCSVDNIGIALRLDRKQDFINKFITATVPSKPSCGAADFNNDGQFSLIDFFEFSKLYNKECSTSQVTSACGNKDINNDGRISLADFQSFSSRYGKRNCKLL